MCGVTPNNIDYVAASINQAVTQVKPTAISKYVDDDDDDDDDLME